MTTNWPIEGSDHHDVSRTAIFTTGQINRFLDGDNVTILIASKGMGKTLLLRTKKRILENSHDGTLIIPRGREYDEPRLEGDLPINYAGFESLEFWRDLWKASIVLSILSHLDHSSNYSGSDESFLDGILEDVENADIRRHIEDAVSEQSHRDPSSYLGTFLSIGAPSFDKFRRQGHIVSDLSSRFIRNGVVVFIDAFDQTLRETFCPIAPTSPRNLNVWKNGQLGLAHAVFRLNTENPHIKVYASIRQEAYAGFRRDDREVIKGRSVILEYSPRELELMLDKAIKVYAGANSLALLLGVDHVHNSYYNAYENPFDYVYRHSSGTPRSIMYIGSRLSEINKNLSQVEKTEEIRRIVNDIAADHILKEYLLDQKQIFLETLSNDSALKCLLNNIGSNILNKESITQICLSISEELEINVGECHVFSELLNIGLLGTLKSDNATGARKQHFRSPSEFDWDQKNLIKDGKVYFLHPGLHSRISEENHKYYLNPKCLIGNGAPWLDGDQLTVFPLIFISHSSHDKNLVEWIIQSVSEKLAKWMPHRIWYDSWSLRAGQYVHQAIEKGVEDSELVLLFLTEKSLDSNWVDREWRKKHMAEINENRIRVVVVLLNDIPEDAVPNTLKDKKFFRLSCVKDSPGCEHELERLALDINWNLRRDH